jgi:hypothetical protein
MTQARVQRRCHQQHLPIVADAPADVIDNITTRAHSVRNHKQPTRFKLFDDEAIVAARNN